MLWWGILPKNPAFRSTYEFTPKVNDFQDHHWMQIIRFKHSPVITQTSGTFLKMHAKHYLCDDARFILSWTWYLKFINEIRVKTLIKTSFSMLITGGNAGFCMLGGYLIYKHYISYRSYPCVASNRSVKALFHSFPSLAFDQQLSPPPAVSESHEPRRWDSLCFCDPDFQSVISSLLSGSALSMVCFLAKSR